MEFKATNDTLRRIVSANKYTIVFSYLYLLASCSLPAHACTFNLAGSNVISLHFMFAESPGACDLGQRFIDQLRHVTAWSAATARVHLMVPEERDGADFDGGSIVTSPLRFFTTGQFEDKHYLPFIHSQTIVAHEFGHAIFEKIAEAQVPSYNRLVAERKRLSLLEIEKLNPRANVREIERQQAAISASIERNPALVRLLVLTIGYSEFVADVVAVYNANNKTAIYESLTPYSAPRTVREHNRCRDFSVEHFADTWTEEESHALLAPTRSFVGRNLWPQTNTQKRNFLNKIIHACIEEIKSRLTEGKVDISAAEINQRLIARLRQNLGKQ